MSATKGQIIGELEQLRGFVDIARKLGISPTTLSHISEKITNIENMVNGLEVKA